MVGDLTWMFALNRVMAHVGAWSHGIVKGYPSLYGSGGTLSVAAVTAPVKKEYVSD